AAELQLRLDPLLDRSETHLLEAQARGLSERLVLQIGERCVAPERERRSETFDRTTRIAEGQRPVGLGSELLEPDQIEVVRGNPQRVAGRPGLDRVLAEQPAELGDL